MDRGSLDKDRAGRPKTSRRRRRKLRRAPHKNLNPPDARVLGEKRSNQTPEEHSRTVTDMSDNHACHPIEEIGGEKLPAGECNVASPSPDAATIAALAQARGARRSLLRQTNIPRTPRISALATAQNAALRIGVLLNPFALAATGQELLHGLCLLGFAMRRLSNQHYGGSA